MFDDLNAYFQETCWQSPLDDPISELRFNVRKPILELNIERVDPQSGEKIIKTFPLSEEQSQTILRVQRGEKPPEIRVNWHNGTVEFIGL